MSSAEQQFAQLVACLVPPADDGALSDAQVLRFLELQVGRASYPGAQHGMAMARAAWDAHIKQGRRCRCWMCSVSSQAHMLLMHCSSLVAMHLASNREVEPPCTHPRLCLARMLAQELFTPEELQRARDKARELEQGTKICRARTATGVPAIA